MRNDEFPGACSSVDGARAGEVQGSAGEFRWPAGEVQGSAGEFRWPAGERHGSVGEVRRPAGTVDLIRDERGERHFLELLDRRPVDR